jgi:hypothetical protein
MQVRETSLEAYEKIKCSGGLQRRELEVLTAVYAHFVGARFTRKELAEAMGWPINCVVGRVCSLVRKGEIVETSARRGGGYLLRLPEKQLEMSL